LIEGGFWHEELGSIVQLAGTSVFMVRSYAYYSNIEWRAFKFFD